MPIYEKHREYLGFSWIFKGQGHVRYFVFNVLPFGVSTAAHIFTKVLRSCGQVLERKRDQNNHVLR